MDDAAIDDVGAAGAAAAVALVVVLVFVAGIVRLESVLDPPCCLTMARPVSPGEKEVISGDVEEKRVSRSRSSSRSSSRSVTVL